MATKTTTKSAARKTPAPRKPVKSVAQKAAPVKAQAPKSKAGGKAPVVEAHKHAPLAEEVEKAEAPKKLETLSLIDEVKPKPLDGEAKVKKTILPPISRLI